MTMLMLVNPTLAKTVNLLLFIGLLYFLLRKPTREFFEQRFASIRGSLQKAAREKDEAAAKLKEIDQRLEQLGSELGNMRAETAREAEAERIRLEEETRREMERLSAAAGREIESAKQSALHELRQFAAEKSVSLAEQVIRHELTPEDDARLVGRAGDGLK
jgi:F-type H+-transporting ATPase subunit b